jgi:hypothetical protein
MTYKPGVSGGGDEVSGDGNGNGLNSAGVGGGPTAKELQAYSLVIYQLYGTTKFTPQQLKWANLCKARKWPASAFLLMIRRFDPAYRRTDAYKASVDKAARIWQRYFPRIKPNHALLDDWARGTSLSSDSLMMRIERTPQFKRLYPYYKLAQAKSPAAGYNPLTYREYRTGLNAAYQMYLGRPASQHEQKLLFSSGLTPADVDKMLPEIMGGNEAFKWAFGNQYDQKSLNNMIYRQPGSASQIGKLQGAAQMRESFMKSQRLPFGLTQNDNQDIVTPRI